MAKKDPIHIKPSHEGIFTEKAQAAGMGVQEFADKVLAPGSHADAATKKEANFAHNAAQWKH
jgi:hypothetical protein